MQLQFERRYVALVMSGAKTQSLRSKFPRGGRVGGDLTLMSGYAPGAKFATATVSALDLVPLAELTEEDARLDGFESLASLMVALEKTYPGTAAVWRVRWTALAAFPVAVSS